MHALTILKKKVMHANHQIFKNWKNSKKTEILSFQGLWIREYQK